MQKDSSKLYVYLFIINLNHQLGFDFDKNPNEVELTNYRKDLLEAGIDALNQHIKNLGGQV